MADERTEKQRIQKHYETRLRETARKIYQKSSRRYDFKGRSLNERLRPFG